MDIFSTVLASAGIDDSAKESLGGRNLLRYLNKEIADAPRETLYWRYYDEAGYAVQNKNYKLVKFAYKDAYLLFASDRDLHERTNLAQQMPEKVRELQRLYKNWNEGLIPGKWQDPRLENVKQEEELRTEFIRKASAGDKSNKDFFHMRPSARRAFLWVADRKLGGYLFLSFLV